MNKELFEVNKAEYKSFVERLIPDKREVIVENKDNFQSYIIKSKKTGTIFCERVVSKDFCKMYIFNYPEPDEWMEAIPKIKITLETKKEVQALMDYLAEVQKNASGVVS